MPDRFDVAIVGCGPSGAALANLLGQAGLAVVVLAHHSRATEIHLRWRPQLRDPGDEFVLEAAINGRADTIVSDKRRDFLPACKRFDIDIMSPARFLDEVLP